MVTRRVTGNDDLTEICAVARVDDPHGYASGGTAVIRRDVEPTAAIRHPVRVSSDVDGTRPARVLLRDRVDEAARGDGQSTVRLHLIAHAYVEDVLRAEQVRSGFVCRLAKDGRGADHGRGVRELLGP